MPPQPSDLKAALLRGRGAYLAGLPRLVVSRCPFTREELSLAVDTTGFDMPWFYPLEPLRSIDPEPPATFLAFTGEVPVGAGTPEVETPWEPGPVWVRTDLLEDERVRAVVSALSIGSTQVWNVAYFTRSPAPELPLAADWGSAFARVRGAGGVWQWVEAPLSTAISFEVEPWLDSGKLLWIRPLDPSVSLEEGPAGFPYA
jgi:hypothetical protein